MGDLQRGKHNLTYPFQSWLQITLQTTIHWAYSWNFKNFDVLLSF